MEKLISHISKKEFPLEELVKGEYIRKSIVHLIQKDFPDFTKDSHISVEELNKYRQQYLRKLMKKESGELNRFEKEVVEAITKNQILTENIETEISENITFPQRLADNIAEFGGSWKFIIFFFAFFALWMGINIYVLASKPFDPYPFILLNLILSCLAAIQAPVIMMSQNRKEQKDRVRSENDFKVNLKAELEIKILNEKVDHLMIHQNRRLLEIQEIQSDYLEDILKMLRTNNQPKGKQ